MKFGDQVLFIESGREFTATVLSARILDHHMGSDDEPLLSLGFFAEVPGVLGTARQNELVQFRSDVAHESHEFSPDVAKLGLKGIYPGGRWKELAGTDVETTVAEPSVVSRGALQPFETSQQAEADKVAANRAPDVPAPFQPIAEREPMHFHPGPGLADLGKGRSGVGQQLSPQEVAKLKAEEPITHVPTPPNPLASESSPLPPETGIPAGSGSGPHPGFTSHEDEANARAARESHQSHIPGEPASDEGKAGAQIPDPIHPLGHIEPPVAPVAEPVKTEEPETLPALKEPGPTVQ